VGPKSTGGVAILEPVQVGQREFVMGASTISVDEFQALEQKVLQTVELIKKEREARAAAEAESAVMKAEIATTMGELAAANAEIDELRGRLSGADDARSEVESLQKEREAVRVRVEKMLATMDELL
jgi:chromosome segregation ATPase